MTTNENDEQIGADMKEMTTIFSVSIGAKTKFSKFQKNKKISLPQLSECHFCRILLIFTGFPSYNYSEEYLECKDSVDRNPWINWFL